MSQAGGIGGGGVAAGSGFSVSQEGMVNLPSGVTADITTEEGMAEAKAQLSPDQLAELEGLMGAMGYKLEGDAFVPDDSYGEGVDRSYAGGPTSVNEGMTPEDEQAGAF